MTHNLADQLRECPFCVSEANPWVVQGYMSNEKYVSCSSCGAKGPRHDEERYAIEMWNDRAVSALEAQACPSGVGVDVRNRINRIISACMTRGMSSEAITDEVAGFLYFLSPVKEQQAVSESVEVSRDEVIDILFRGGDSHGGAAHSYSTLSAAGIQLIRRRK